MSDEISQTPDSLVSASFSQERWRNSFLKLVLRGGCVLGLAAAVFSIVDLVRNGQLLLAGIYEAACVLLVAITVFRLPYWLRAGIFLFLLYALGISGLLENGMRGDARLFFIFVSIMTTLLVDPRAGMAALGFCLLTISAFAPFALTGRFHLLSKVTTAGNLDLWIASSLDLLVIGAATLIGLTLLLREFWASKSRIEKVVGDLAQERYRTIFHHSPVSLWEEDISELRAEIRALKERGVEDLAQYLEKSPDFVERAVRAIRVVDVNDATLRLQGAETKEQLLGPLGRTLEPSALSAHKEQILAIVEGRRLHERESTATTLKRDLLHVLISCSIPEENDQYQHMLVNVFDISERKRAEEALRASEQKARAIFDVSFGLIGLLSPDRTVLDANRTSLDLAGIELSDVAGKSS